MKSQIIKFAALIALLMGGFSLSAQNIERSLAFAIDKNITSLEVANLVDKVITEYPSRPNGRTQESLSPHFWTITLIMAEGTDVTKLAPIITLAPGATITSRHSNVQDFSKQVDYTVIAEDGSTVTYAFLAYTQEKTRGWGATFYSSPKEGGTVDDIYNIDNTWWCKAYPNAPTFYFTNWNVKIFCPTQIITYFENPLKISLNCNAEITAVFKSDVQYTVTVQSEDANKGTVYGGGTCYAGEAVPISASPKQGYTFEGWYLNGSKIPGLSSFDYSPLASCTLIAKFNQIPPIISGPSSVCPGSSATFTAQNFPGTVSWSCSSGLSLSSQGNTATVTNTSSLNTSSTNTSSLQSDNTAEVSANSIQLSTADSSDNPLRVPPNLKLCANPVGWVRAEIQGTPIAVQNDLTINTNCILNFDLPTADASTGGNYFYHGNIQTSVPTAVSWSVTPSANAATWEDGLSTFVLSVSQNGTYTVTATTQNSCGNYSLSKKIAVSGISIICPTCPPILFSLPIDTDSISKAESSSLSIAVYPNPSSNEITIDMTSNVSSELIASSGQSTGLSYKVKILDLHGAVVYDGHKKGKKFHLTTSSLRNGTYTVIVSDGINTAQHKLIIKH